MAISSLSKTRVEDKEENVYEKNYGYVPRTTPIEQSILHVEFPLEAYWRKIVIKKTIGEKIRNVEGLIYPSFSDIVFPAEYKIEMLEPKKFLIHHARGYVPCPVCGKNIVAKLEDYEITTSNEITDFTPEVAYELVISSLSKELAARIKAHVVFKHGYKFTRKGREIIYITRYTGRHVVILEAKISTYTCPIHPSNKLYGVYGILDHIVNYHSNTRITKEIMKFIERLSDTTEKIFGLGKENIPLIGVYRNTFRYLLDTKGSGKDKPRVLEVVYFKPWLHVRAVEFKDHVDLIITMNIPRPMRMIYHYPIFRYVPHVLAYKINPKYYVRFYNRLEKTLRRKRYSTKNLEKMYELVTGGLAYSKIEPKNAFTIDINTLENLRETIETIGEEARVFLLRKQKGW